MDGAADKLSILRLKPVRSVIHFELKMIFIGIPS